MKELGEQYLRYGYLMLHELLRREGLVIDRKRTYRIYCELGRLGQEQTPEIESSWTTARS